MWHDLRVRSHSGWSFRSTITFLHSLIYDEAYSIARAFMLTSISQLVGMGLNTCTIIFVTLSISTAVHAGRIDRLQFLRYLQDTKRSRHPHFEMMESRELPPSFLKYFQNWDQRSIRNLWILVMLLWVSVEYQRVQGSWLLVLEIAVSGLACYLRGLYGRRLYARLADLFLRPKADRIHAVAPNNSRNKTENASHTTQAIETLPYSRCLCDDNPIILFRYLFVRRINRKLRVFTHRLSMRFTLLPVLFARPRNPRFTRVAKKKLKDQWDENAMGSQKSKSTARIFLVFKCMIHPMLIHKTSQKALERRSLTNEMQVLRTTNDIEQRRSQNTGGKKLRSASRRAGKTRNVTCIHPWANDCH